MSQEVISQKIKKTCDGCGSVHEYEMVDPSEAMMQEIENWYTVGRAVRAEGRVLKMMAEACCLACVPAAAVKLALPPAAPEPEIDLASLRLNTERPN